MWTGADEPVGGDGIVTGKAQQLSQASIANLQNFNSFSKTFLKGGPVFSNLLDSDKMAAL